MHASGQGLCKSGMKVRLIEQKQAVNAHARVHVRVAISDKRFSMHTVSCTCEPFVGVVRVNHAVSSP
jgi:hypothetical protein